MAKGKEAFSVGVGLADGKLAGGMGNEGTWA